MASLPIHIAAIECHFHIIQEMLQHCPDLMELLTCKGQNILHVAAKSGRAEAVSYMLKKMPELEKLIDEKDEDGNTPLQLATIFEHPKVVRALTSNKRVNLKVENNGRLTALDIADEYMDTMVSFRKKRLNHFMLMVVWYLTFNEQWLTFGEMYLLVYNLIFLV
ncbi:Protein accellerated cell death 6 [Vitis vinifera]|uniref:Protein accellerated cell death 6 n=1 Tax=Vitis vinifera TaxID=29760 RepID=A0A438CCN8_VITVI|nr:Protein accellerated cell death 6 [Vitis vinifera]